MGVIMNEKHIYFPGLYVKGLQTDSVRKLREVGTEFTHFMPKPIELTETWLKAFKWIPATYEKDVYKYYLKKTILAINLKTKVCYIDRPNSRIPVFDANFVHEMQHAIAFFSNEVPTLTYEEEQNLSNILNIKFL